MKKLNKLFLAAGSFAAIAAPIAAVVSCGAGGSEVTPALDENGKVVVKNVTLALDGHDHSEADKSFNELAANGIKTYTGASSVPVVKPAQPDGENEFKQMYATVAKGSTIVAPGFLHINPLSTASEEINGKNIILLDGEVAKANIASVVYETQQAAFLGGYALAEYASTQAGFDAIDVNPKSSGTVKISSFGGLDIPTVTSFMGGFQKGVEAGIAAAKADTTHYPKANNVVFTKLGSRSAHFSGGFAQGGGTTLTNNLLAEGVDVILPVAGGQTADVVAQPGVKIVGVDSEQEKQYQADKFLFSILKNLQDSTVNILKKLAGETVDASFKGLGETTHGTLDNGLVGISNFTAPITQIYNVAKADNTLAAQAKAVSQTFFYS